MHEVLSIWTVYDHPTDWPGHFVARRFEMDEATDDVLLSTEVEALRGVLQARGLIRLDRHPTDDPVIMEIWI